MFQQVLSTQIIEQRTAKWKQESSEKKKIIDLKRSLKNDSRLHFMTAKNCTDDTVERNEVVQK